MWWAYMGAAVFEWGGGYGACGRSLRIAGAVQGMALHYWVRSQSVDLSRGVQTGSGRA